MRPNRLYGQLPIFMCMAGFFGLSDSFGAQRFRLQVSILMTLGRFAIPFAFGLAAAIESSSRGFTGCYLPL